MSSESSDLLGRLVRLLVTVSQWWGTLVDLVEKLNSESGEDWERELSRFLRKEPTWVRRWREKDGVIYFSVTSDGTTGEQWIARLESKGFRLSDYAKSVLRSSDFKPTKGITTEVAILKGELFSDSDRVTKNIRDEAVRRKLQKPNAEVACLIREMFTDKEIEAMGLWWIAVFHEPINGSDGGPRLLSAGRGGDGRWLAPSSGELADGWSRGRGFAFAVSQVSSLELCA
jgi:hypothetical protein